MKKPIGATDLTRRGFLAATSAVTLGALVGCGSSSSAGSNLGSNPVDETKAYRLSTRDVGSASNAAKLHAGNMRFVSPEAAEASRAHRGDKSRIVPIDIKRETWQKWFGGGATKVDLRHL
jgi:hypothetical protein